MVHVLGWLVISTTAIAVTLTAEAKYVIDKEV